MLLLSVVAEGLNLSATASTSDIAFIKMTNRDVVRHPLVQKIVKAYDEYENNEHKKQPRNNINATAFRGKKQK